MGWHDCEYCLAERRAGVVRKVLYYRPISTGDVTMNFASGKSYVVPDGILHYVADHNYAPPSDFVADVMHSHLVSGSRRQTRSFEGNPTPIGYLSGDFPTVVGEVAEGFGLKLLMVMEQAGLNAERVQFQGV